MERFYQLIRLPSLHVDYNNNDINRQPGLDQLLDAPHEPPRNLEPLAEPEPAALMPQKKRSHMTISQPFRIQSEVSELQRNAWQAIQDVPEEQRRDHYVNYMMENLNSQNYPHGVGLPHRWGQF
ncbi:male-specific protein scotti [Drosophila guanche]|uniref:Male-specific protein scotti n=1 Tax=Drosophila guanche TaxID=7266 RepID=A0A3B0JXN5_DROGU|nr:male-specific protein scotti [Drosophila guanche]SPP80270.1 blast:Male-specific protein scotti [Drosophila guanche]